MELKVFSKFKQEKYNLIDNICRCDNYEDIMDILKRYVAEETIKSLSTTPSKKKS